LSVALCLFSIYLFIYRGGFHSIDEVSIFSVTESLVKFGRFDTNQIAWTQWTTSQAEAQGFFGRDGQVYSKKGLALSLVQAPLYWLALHLPGLGMLQTVSLLNALITAATGSLILILLRRLGFSPATALITTFIFGLATIAIIYARYLFSEPLAGLLLLLAASTLLVYRQEGGARWPMIAGLAAGFAVLTRANNLFLLPIFGLYLLKIGSWSGSRSLDWRATLGHPVASFALGLAPAGVILLAYNTLRSGNPFQTGYDLTLFSPDIWLGLYKLLFSPLRGLFIYSPILLLSLPGWWYLRRTSAAEAWLFAGLIGVTTALFSAWSSGEGLSWGSRFLVPVVPFCVICLAPLVERLTNDQPTNTTRHAPAITFYVLRFTFYTLLILSITIQILGLAINPWVFLARLQTDFGGEFFLENTEALYDFRYSQIVGQLQTWSVENSDLVWWQAWGFDGWAFGLSLGLVLFSAWFLWRTIVTTPGHPMTLSLAVLICAGVTYLLLIRYYQTDHQFGPPDDPYTQALQRIAQQTQAGQPIVSVAPYHYHVPMNRFKADTPLIGFAQQSWPLPETALPLLKSFTAYPAIWLVTIGFPIAAPDNAVEQWLALNTFKAGDQWLPDETRVVRFSSIQPAVSHSLNAVFENGIRLGEVKLAVTSQPGRLLPVEFTWQTGTHLDVDYILFLQLLDANGALVAQHDSPPNGGYTTTSNWPTNRPVTSRQALVLPQDLSPGAYRLIAGLYDPATGRRLTLDDNRDFVELGEVTIVAA
jgi:hypothetical protein